MNTQLDADEVLLSDLHIQFFQNNLKNASQKLTDLEPIKPTVLLFMLSGLDILDAMGDLDAQEKYGICDWIYSQQIQPDVGLEENENELKRCGFIGSRSLVSENENKSFKEFNAGHLAMTFSCLNCLIILGDNLSRVNKRAILQGIHYLQNNDGSFLSCVIDGQTDLRFIYCAVAICYILNDFSYIDSDKAVSFILSAMNYDGGIGLFPNLESHGGSAFLGIAALSLLGKLDNSLTDPKLKKLERWLIMKQENGFQGRPHKEVDCCYSFWIGATLKILGIFSLVNWKENRKSILKCQKNTTGGFSKASYSTPDLLHTYFALCGLSLMEEKLLKPIHLSLNISLRAYSHLKNLHNSWIKMGDL